MAEISVRQALEAGLQTVVTSDIDQLLASSSKLGAIAVKRPEELANDDKHYDAIRHALGAAYEIDSYLKGLPVILLQPTSPFRLGNIIQRCLDAYAKEPHRAVLSGRTIHGAGLDGRTVSMPLWDGCVAVYPHDKVETPSDPILVENEHANMLQVDTEEDYIQACVQHWRLNGAVVPFGKDEAKECVNALRPLLGNQTATLVARPDDKQIDQSRPVVWLNHCVGWDGGRADAVVLVASKNLVKVGFNPELIDAMSKAKVVVVRDFGQGEWVKAQLKTDAKIVFVKQGMYQVTTGCFASILIAMSGGRAERVGFSRGIKRVPYCIHTMPNPKVSEEIAMLEVSGYER